METYSIKSFQISGTVNYSVLRSGDGASIPLDPDNTDYQQFLKDWEAGAEVLNPDGTPAPYVAPEPK